MKKTYLFAAYPAILLVLDFIMYAVMPGNHTLASLTGASLFIAAVLALKLVHCSPELPRQKFLFTNVILACAALFAYACTICIIFELVSGVADTSTAAHGLLKALINDTSLLFILAFFVLMPIAEELAFRYGLQSILRSRFSDVLSMLITTAVFTLYCWYVYGSAYILYYFLTGFLLSLIYEKTASAIACSAAHGIMQISQIMPVLVMLLPKSYGIALAVLMAVIAAVFLYWWIRHDSAFEKHETKGMDS